MTIQDQFRGCMLGGAIGDAWGSSYENQMSPTESPGVFYPFGPPRPQPIPPWRITDDTQLTLATCEAISEHQDVSAEAIARKFLAFYQARRITGVGASTLKALRELEMGGHWSQVGRKGEYAAGNGAAMRIAPLAFLPDAPDRQLIEEVSRLTHHHDEAYAGALSVVLGIRAVLTGAWTGSEDLLGWIAAQLPDTRVKDRLLQIAVLGHHCTIQEIADQFGKGGYVVESVPLALLAASKVAKLGFEPMLQEVITTGGDTDTNCSIAGQLAGTLLGAENLPASLKQKVSRLPEYDWITRTIDQFIRKRGWK